MRVSLDHFMSFGQVMKEHNTPHAIDSMHAAAASVKDSSTNCIITDLRVLRLLLLLKVAGERRAEIEELLRETRGFSLKSSAQPTELQPSNNCSSKRHLNLRPWRKHNPKKKSSQPNDSSNSSSISSTTVSSSASSSVKSSVSSPLRHDHADRVSDATCLLSSSNGHSDAVMENSDSAFLKSISADISSTSDMSMLQRLALNALNLTAPASSVLLRNRRNSWVQLSGHPGSLAPAGPGTIWKKRGPDPVETQAYQALAKDPARAITPTFFREILYQEDYFIEMQDLLYDFHNPCVMDIKMGTRTFLESEVSNTKAREDLYEKMIKVEATAPSPDEHKAKAVTKLRYMDFRDNMSSSRSLGFRIEALKMTGSEAVNELQTVRSRKEVISTMSGFLKGRETTKRQVLSHLQNIKNVFGSSPFFQKHEVIGSSILIVYDEEKAGVWMIDFAKTVPVPEGISLTHEDPWVLGNHEEGFLTGIDNLIKIVEEVHADKPENPDLLSKS